MKLDKIRDFRIGCKRENALLHLSKEQLDQALKTGKLEEVEGLYYAVMGKIGAQSYVSKDVRPLRWNLSCQWALPTYQK